MKKILITGGAGFIGSHLTDLLLKQGNFVRILDNFSSGKLKNLPTGNPNLEILTGDIRNQDEVAEAVKGIDGVVHLAAVASVQASVEDPDSTHGSNFIGTLNLLEDCRREKIKRFLYASSAAVYGDVTTLPVSEDTPLNPLTPYAADKLAGEYYLDFYRREHRIEPGIFRFFNVFGPRQDPSSPYSGVISIFADRSISKQPITVFGDGEQTRDFIYVNDLTRILLQALNSDTIETGPVNVGTGQQTSINKIIDTLGHIQQQKLTVSYASPRPGDIKYSVADISRLQTRFAFKPEVSLKQGLKKLLDYAK